MAKIEDFHLRDIIPESMYGRVAAIVPTYNRKDLLIECIDGLLRQTAAVARVIVVDNASTDGTVESLRERYAGSPAVEVHALRENTGASGGFHEAGRMPWRGMRLDLVYRRRLGAETRCTGGPATHRGRPARKRDPRGGADVLKVGRDGVVQHKHTGRFTWRMVPSGPASAGSRPCGLRLLHRHPHRPQRARGED
jgi:hypothetical protein